MRFGLAGWLLLTVFASVAGWHVYYELVGREALAFTRCAAMRGFLAVVLTSGCEMAWLSLFC